MAMRTLAAIAMLVVTGVVWWSTAERRDSPPDALGAPLEQEASSERALAEVEAPAPVSEEVRQESPGESASAPAAGPDAGRSARPTAAVDARFVDPAGAPWEGVRLGVHDARFEWGRTALSQADGRARLDLTLPDLRDEDGPVLAHTLDFVASRAGCTTVVLTALVRAGETAHLGDVVLAAGVRLSGRVVDEQGRALAGAQVGRAPAELPSEEDGRLRRHGSKVFGPPVTESTGDGTFVLDGIGAGTWRLWGHATGTRYGWSEPLAVTAERDLVGLELVLAPLLTSDRIAGRVVDEQDAPVRTELWCHVHDARYGGFGRGEPVDEQGRFSIVVEHDGELWDLTANDFTGRLATTTVEAVAPGTLDVVLRMRAQRLVDVRVRAEDGQPVEGASFLVGVGGAYAEARAETAGPGTYRLPIPDTRFRMEVSARGFRTAHPRPFDPAALPSPLEIVLRRAPAVRGRVVAAGHGLAGARVELRSDDPEALETVNGFRCVMSSMAEVEGTAGADGRFELTADLDGRFWIRATAAGFAPAELGLLDPASLPAELELVLTTGGAIEGRVLAPAGVAAEGVIVAINHGDGAPRTVRAGPDGAFRFDGLAPGMWQVLASDADVDPARGSYSSLDEAEEIEWSCEVLAGRTTRFDLDLTAK